VYLARIDDIDRGEEVADLNRCTGFFEGFPGGAFGNGLTQFHESRGNRPESVAWFYSPLAKQDFPVLFRHAADHDVRILVMRCIAQFADPSFPMIAGGFLSYDTLAAICTKVHWRKHDDLVR
jgi:hypothetical protein